jgi:hypothetical protein
MTPKEKAKELVYKYLTMENTLNIIDLPYLEMSKQSALIAVGEILSETEERDGMRVINNPYWMEVRNEIDKL